MTFDVNLSSASGAAIATATGVGTIVDTIGSPPTPPVVNNVSTETLEGTPVTLNVLADASDADGYTLSLASFTQPSHGTVTENSSDMLVYTPAAALSGGRLVHVHGLRWSRRLGHWYSRRLRWSRQRPPATGRRTFSRLMST